jgi:hypothetical protein
LYDVTHQKVNEDQQDPVSDGPTLTVHDQADSLSDGQKKKKKKKKKKGRDSHT